MIWTSEGRTLSVSLTIKVCVSCKRNLCAPASPAAAVTRACNVCGRTHARTHGRSARRSCRRALLNSCWKRKKRLSCVGQHQAQRQRACLKTGEAPTRKADTGAVMRPPKEVESAGAEGRACSPVCPLDAWRMTNVNKHAHLQQHGHHRVGSRAAQPNDTKKWCCGGVSSK